MYTNPTGDYFADLEPHEILLIAIARQARSDANNQRLQENVRSDAAEFLGWLLHLLGVSPCTKRAIMHNYTYPRYEL